MERFAKGTRVLRRSKKIGGPSTQNLRDLVVDFFREETIESWLDIFEDTVEFAGALILRVQMIFASLRGIRGCEEKW